MGDIDITRTIFVAVRVADLSMQVEYSSINMFVHEDVENGTEMSVDELFSIYNSDAGYLRKRDGVLHRVFPMYGRKFAGFEPPVLEIHDNLEDFNFDEIELIEE
jgi:hypothetical protein